MASPTVAVIAAANSWNPVVAFGAIAIASYVDQQYLYPQLIKGTRDDARPRPLVGLPQSTTLPGSPRVWACGRRIRVPTHVMYQTEKVREDTISGPKGGVAQQIRRVFADVGLAINDRKTQRLTQLIANGQLIYWTDKNLVRIQTSRMTSSLVTTTVGTGTVAAGSTTTAIVRTGGGLVDSAYERNYRWVQMTSGALALQARPIRDNTTTTLTVDRAFSATPVVGTTFSIIEKRLVLTMDTNYEPDFSDYFEVGDVVNLEGFTSTPANTHLGVGGSDPFGNKSWWRVNATTAHGATPSTVTLEALNGQDIGPMTSVQAGTTFLPGAVVREDYHFLYQSEYDPLTFAWTGSVPGVTFISDRSAQYQDNLARRWASFMGADFEKLTAVWRSGFLNSITGVFTSYANPYGIFSRFGFDPVDRRFPYLQLTSGSRAARQSIQSVCSNNAAVFIPGLPLSYEQRMFASDPLGAFYQGTDEQLPNTLVSTAKGEGLVPAFRGLCYQMLEQWDLSTYFGNQVPPIIEAIIEPDLFFSLPQAILAVCERANARDVRFDTSQVNVAPFEGYWTQGAIPTVTALQPLLTAYQVAAQERNDVLCFFNIENADVVQIVNGPSLSDLGVTSGADTPRAGDKMRITQRDVAELPSSVGVSHQDPDAQYTQGYQHFKQRQPSPLATVNEQNIQLDNVVLSRKQARNLAGTLMRRAWVNGTALEMQLPIAYAEVLENDLITVTDDEGHDYVARVVRRELGNNLVVNLYAVVEDVSLAVRGSPVQRAAPPPIGTPTLVPVDACVLDIPPLDDRDATAPGYYVGAASPSGWAGCLVYESRDAGTTWTQVATLNEQVGIGELTTTLPSGVAGDGIGGVTWDTTSTFTCRLRSFGPSGEPLTSTEAEVLLGYNWLLVEDGGNFEILGARDVTALGDGLFQFDHLIRGLRGTYDSCATIKAIGSRVTLLHDARQRDALRFVPVNVNGSSLPLSVQVKFVPAGATLADVVATSVSVDGWNARPMPGKFFTSELDLGTYDRNFLFDYWTRKQVPVGSGTPSQQLDESFEGYAVRIYDPTGVTLVRTKTISSLGTGSNRIRGDRSCPYLAAEQTADGYTPGPTTTFKVQRVQLGDFGEGRTWTEDA